MRHRRLTTTSSTVVTRCWRAASRSRSTRAACSSSTDAFCAESATLCRAPAASCRRSAASRSVSALMTIQRHVHCTTTLKIETCSWLELNVCLFMSELLLHRQERHFVMAESNSRESLLHQVNFCDRFVYKPSLHVHLDTSSLLAIAYDAQNARCSEDS